MLFLVAAVPKLMDFIRSIVGDMAKRVEEKCARVLVTAPLYYFVLNPLLLSSSFPHPEYVCCWPNVCKSFLHIHWSK